MVLGIGCQLRDELVGLRTKSAVESKQTKEGTAHAHGHSRQCEKLNGEGVPERVSYRARYRARYGAMSRVPVSFDHGTEDGIHKRAALRGQKAPPVPLHCFDLFSTLH